MTSRRSPTTPRRFGIYWLYVEQPRINGAKDAGEATRPRRENGDTTHSLPPADGNKCTWDGGNVVDLFEG